MRKLFVLCVALLVLCGITPAQTDTYVYDVSGGIRSSQIADVRIYPGQLVSRLANGHVTPTIAGSTSGVVGVATTSAFPGGIELVGVLGTFPVSVDNTCAAGNSVSISATVNGNGTCSSGFPNGQLVGMFFDGTASGSVTVHITPDTSQATVSSGGGSMTWPAAAGIAVYAGGSAWGTSLTAPVGTIVGTSDTQTLTNKTIDGVAPATMAFLDATSSIQTQLNARLTASSSLTTGIIPQITGTETIGNSSPVLDNGVTTPNTLTYSGSGGVAAAQVTTTGSNAGASTCGAGPGNGVGGTSTIRVECPSSVTAYDIVLPTVAGSANQVMQIASVASSVLTMQWATISSGVNPTVNGMQVWNTSAWRSTAVTSADISGVVYAVGGGTANAQTVALSPAVTSLTAGLQVCWLPVATNTANTVTLAVNGLTAENIIAPNGATVIQPNDLITTRIACAIYDGTNFELQNRQLPFFTGTGVFSGGLSFNNQNSTYTNALGFGNTANQAINGGPSAANSMLRGQITITNPATTGTYTFPLSSGGQAYTNTPLCVASADTTSAIFAVTGAPWVDSVATTNLQLQVDVAVTPAASIKVNYVCFGFPN